MEALADKATMTALDLPGHGGSGDWTGRGDYLTRCVDVARSFIDGPTDLVGHSFGAVIALSLMAQSPELVRRAVLVEPVFFAAAEGTKEYDRNAAEYDEIRAALDAGDREAATARFTAIWGAGDPWHELPSAQRRKMASRTHLVAAAAPGLMDDSTGILSAGRLERVTAPILLVRGSDSHPIIPAILDSLACRLPDTAQSVVDGAGHMAPITHPKETAALVNLHLHGTDT